VLGGGCCLRRPERTDDDPKLSSKQHVNPDRCLDVARRSQRWAADTLIGHRLELQPTMTAPLFQAYRPIRALVAARR
jgi:hypothetical protein